MVSKIKSKGPKRPQTGFFRFKAFLHENDEKMKATKGVTTQTSYAAELWRNLSDSERAEYNEKSKKEFITWRVEYNNFKTTKDYQDELEAKKRVKVIKRKQKNMVKGIDVFKRQENENAKVQKKEKGKDFENEIKEKWANMSQEEKTEFNKIAKAENKENMKQMHLNSSSDN